MTYRTNKVLHNGPGDRAPKSKTYLENEISYFVPGPGWDVITIIIARTFTKANMEAILIHYLFIMAVNAIKTCT